MISDRKMRAGRLRRGHTRPFRLIRTL